MLLNGTVDELVYQTEVSLATSSLLNSNRSRSSTPKLKRRTRLPIFLSGSESVCQDSTKASGIAAKNVKKSLYLL